MLGAVIGDIVGSRFERHNYRAKDFDLLTYKCSLTDDSIMTLAVAQAILTSKMDHSDLAENAVKYMQSIGRRYPNCGYGSGFRKWLFSDNPQPYNSFGNGAAMRVSAVGFAAQTLDEAILMSKLVTAVTHNHSEGLKGAEATVVSIYMARKGKSILDIRDYIDKHYYPMNFTLDAIRDSYEFSSSCQGSVPQALMAFFESTGFEDAIRNAVSIGGDSDTIAAIAGGVAEAYYGIPADIRKHVLTFLNEDLLRIVVDFENKYPPVMEHNVGNITVSVKRKVSDSDIKCRLDANDVKEADRADLMESAVSAADMDVKNVSGEVKEITSNRLFSHLYQCCSILHGPVNQDEYKSYVLPILFFKRLSDVYDEEYAAALVMSGGDEEYAALEENHTFVIPKDCHWNNIRQVAENVGQAIESAMRGIEKANPDTLGGIFSSFDDAVWTDKSKLTDERLKDLIEHMSMIAVGNKNYSADVMGDSYEYLIRQFADDSKKNAGEFYTPRPIVRLMVRLLDPKPGDTVYDPACGTGGMLIEAIHHMEYSPLTYGKIFGQEINMSTSAIARINLFLHGTSDVKIEQGDTLRDPKFLEAGQLKTFTHVLANPPFGKDKWGAAQFAADPWGRNLWGSPSDSNADFAWLQHMVKSMEPEAGKCAVVLPQGVLFHGGKEGQMREKLIRSDKLEAVITLAGGVFYSTGVSACILFLNNRKQHTHKGRICLIDGSSIFTAKRAQNVLSDENVNALYNYYHDYKDVTEYVKVITIEDAEKGGFELMPKKYIEHKTQETTPPYVVRQNYISALERVKAAEAKVNDLLIKGGYV